MEMAFIWIILGVFLLILEIFMADFTLASIGLACLITSVFALIGLNIYFQLAIMTIALILIFSSIRPFLIKLIQGKESKEAKTLNTLINKKGVVSETINNSLNTGYVKINGDTWKAVSITGEEILEGEKVIVKKMESITVFVEKIS